MLFIAGHGLTDKRNEYHFLPYDVMPSRLWTTSLSQEAIIGFLDARRGGKCVVLIDTCHAGALTGLGGTTLDHGAPAGATSWRVDVDRGANDLAHGVGVAVITSSTGAEDSVEDQTWGNGAFTEALLEGLRGQADYQKNGVITLHELNLYLSSRVPVLTGNKQTPMCGGRWIDFPVARVSHER